jgi:hypothetical protein
MSEIHAAIEAVDYARAFRRFESEKVSTLQRYHHLCVELGQGTFFSNEVKFTFSAGEQRNGSALKHAGKDALKATMMDLRQFRMDKERTHFPTVRNALSRNARSAGTAAADDAKLVLAGIKTRYQEAMAEPMIHWVKPEDLMRPVMPGDETVQSFSADEVIDNWCYGGAFHWDEEKAEILRHTRPETYEFQFVKAIHAACRSYFELDLMIQHILGEPTLLPQPVAA